MQLVQGVCGNGAGRYGAVVTQVGHIWSMCPRGLNRRNGGGRGHHHGGSYLLRGLALGETSNAKNRSFGWPSRSSRFGPLNG